MYYAEEIQDQNNKKDSAEDPESATCPPSGVAVVTAAPPSKV